MVLLQYIYGFTTYFYGFLTYIYGFITYIYGFITNVLLLLFLEVPVTAGRTLYEPPRNRNVKSLSLMTFDEASETEEVKKADTNQAFNRQYLLSRDPTPSPLTTQ